MVLLSYKDFGVQSQLNPVFEGSWQARGLTNWECRHHPLTQKEISTAFSRANDVFCILSGSWGESGCFWGLGSHNSLGLAVGV